MILDALCMKNLLIGNNVVHNCALITFSSSMLTRVDRNEFQLDNDFLGKKE